MTDPTGGGPGPVSASSPGADAASDSDAGIELRPLVAPLHHRQFSGGRDGGRPASPPPAGGGGGGGGPAAAAAAADPTPHPPPSPDAAPAGTATPRQMVVNIFISFVGAGMLGMPHAFSRSGWALGVVCLSSVSALNVHCMLLLVSTRKRLEDLGLRGIAGYGDVGRIVLGTRGETLVNASLVISQVGFSTAYLIFIAANLPSIYEGLSRGIICLGCVPGLAALAQVRDMAVLSPFSLVADVANLSGTATAFLQDFEAYRGGLVGGGESLKAFDFSAFLYVTALSIYSLEGVGLVLPLESSCLDRGAFPRLLARSVAGITALIAAFGVAGYAAFGSGTSSPVTLNLSGPSASFVKLSLCVALYLTYPVMLFPVWLVAPAGGWGRSALVAGTAAVAYSCPDFGKFLGLVGASICTLLGFVLPSVFHLLVFGGDSFRAGAGAGAGTGTGTGVGRGRFRRAGGTRFAPVPPSGDNARKGGGDGYGDGDDGEWDGDDGEWDREGDREGGRTPRTPRMRPWERWLDLFLVAFGVVFGILGTYSSLMDLLGLDGGVGVGGD